MFELNWFGKLNETAYTQGFETQTERRWVSANYYFYIPHIYSIIITNGSYPISFQYCWYFFLQKLQGYYLGYTLTLILWKVHKAESVEGEDVLLNECYFPLMTGSQR